MTWEDAEPQDVDEVETEDQRLLICRACGQELADEEALVSIAGGATVRQFVNPAGVMHEVITVVGAHDIRDHGEGTEDFSWFAGWAWRFTDCGSCQAFVGWCLEAVDPGLQPPRFHGLRLAAVAWR